MSRMIGEKSTPGLMNLAEAESLAYEALAWALCEPIRARRLLDLTGLDPAGLRDSVGMASVQAAILGFLLDHEPDLIACAEALARSPGDIARARHCLESSCVRC
jgi:hypothetical protein